MEWNISNRRREATIALAVGLAVFSVIFMITGALLEQVNGLVPGDEGYTNYLNVFGEPNTPYQDLLANACLTAPHTDADQTFTMDTKGLESLGILFYDPNICFDMAKNTQGYTIDKVETYGTDQMKITLVKK